MSVSVFTNGCFDVLHAGHVYLLEQARALGDRLVVGLNSDASVRLLGKGPDRPINNERDRRDVLMALRCVDNVILFDEDTPEELIKAIRPQILVKGGDWKGRRVAGADLVEQVVFIPILEGYSTTAMLEKLK